MNPFQKLAAKISDQPPLSDSTRKVSGNESLSLTSIHSSHESLGQRFNEFSSTEFVDVNESSAHSASEQ